MEKRNNPLTIQVKYHTDIETLKKIKIGSWIDLRAAETVYIHPGEYKCISLGISCKLPCGYEAHVAPRSSSFRRWGIIQTNGVGVIDASYSGDNDIWTMPVYGTRETVINKGDRICQFRIVKEMPDVTFETVDHLADENRGGLGSTGVR